jgi:ribosomal RNA-processing protein 1
MSDKREIQNELSEALADSVHQMPLANQMGYLKGFWSIMAMEWNGIDRLRLNKYYFAMKRFLFHGIKYSSNSNWSNLKELMQVLPIKEKEKIPDGIRLFVIEHFFQELKEYLPVSVKTQMEIFAPFVSELAYSSKKSILSKLEEVLRQVLQLELDFQVLKNTLFEFASLKDVQDNNRRVLLKLYQECPGEAIKKMLPEKAPALVSLKKASLVATKPLNSDFIDE